MKKEQKTAKEPKITKKELRESLINSCLENDLYIEDLEFLFNEYGLKLDKKTRDELINEPYCVRVYSKNKK